MIAVSLACVAGGATACGGTGDGSAGTERDIVAAVSSVPQRAAVLGGTSAPFTLGVYVAPTSFRMSTTVLPQLPALISRFVRDGRLKIKVRLLGGAPYGAAGDARRATELVQAAGLQSRFWSAFVHFAYTYAGTLDQFAAKDLLRVARVGDVSRAWHDSTGRRVTHSIRRNDRIASLAGSKGWRDTYVVADARGVQLNVTADANAGRLVPAVANAMSLIKR
jgi:hypothetical protein